jgi:predicted nucleotide-binding protein
MLTSALKRRNCIIVHHQHLELPSKLEGTPSVSFKNTVHEAMPELIQRLQTAGFRFDDAAVRRALH